MPKSIDQITKNPNWSLAIHDPKTFQHDIIEMVKKHWNDVDEQQFQRDLSIIQKFNVIREYRAVNRFQNDIKDLFTKAVYLQNDAIQNQNDQALQNLDQKIATELHQIMETLIDKLSKSIQNQINNDSRLNQMYVKLPHTTIQIKGKLGIPQTIRHVNFNEFAQKIEELRNNAFDLWNLDPEQSHNWRSYFKDHIQTLPNYQSSNFVQWIIYWTQYTRFVNHLNWLVTYTFENTKVKPIPPSFIYTLNSQSEYGISHQLNWLIRHNAEK